MSAIEGRRSYDGLAEGTAGSRLLCYCFGENEQTIHVRGDAAALDRLFGDDLVVVVPGMRVMAKTDALGMFTAGRMKFDRYETSETKFRVYDDTAIVIGRLRRTRVIAGATVDDDWRFTKVYVRRADRWQVVSFHASHTAS